MKKNWDVRVRLKNANEKIMKMQSLKGLIIIHREGGGGGLVQILGQQPFFTHGLKEGH